MVDKTDNSWYYSQDTGDVLLKLKTTIKGLSDHEAEQRLHDYGFNELKTEEGLNPLTIIIQQFTSPLVWILIVAAIISAFLHEYIDVTIIAVIIVLNAILGFIQEYRAERAIQALQKMAALKAKVLREGKTIKIESKLLVPGDIIFLETGDKVPADCRLLEVHELQTQEAELTGESLPVKKDVQKLNKDQPLADRKNMVYSSTIVSKGRAVAVICKTGMLSEVGKIASQIKEVQEKSTPLQKKLRTLGKYLTIATIFVAIIVFLAGVLSGKDLTVMLLTAIALAVAAIPEGLPAVITIALALGVQRMIKKNSLVRKLPLVETLGSVNVICTDKTGTLTHNQMTVTKIWANDKLYEVTGSGYKKDGKFMTEGKTIQPPNELLKIGLHCNDARLEIENENTKKETINVIGDPTEAALIVSANKAGLNDKDKYKRIDEIAFSSERKMMTTIHENDKGKISYTKGSPEIVLAKCNRILIDGKVERIDREIQKKILQQNQNMAGQALRVLAFAYNKDFTNKAYSEQNMIFVGLQGMIDPPREEVKESIKICQQAGIKVVMITGDQLTTAVAIAKQLGIDGRAVEGSKLKDINLEKEINNISIFARVNPEHKLDIVTALKKKKYVVAMTGDGVNDAPALKKADIGVAMGLSGTDVAKEASDMILTDDNFASIVSAVEEGRGIYDNIKKFVNYLLSTNLGEITVILFASLLALPLPLTAIQILWINLVTDGLPAVALGVDPHDPKIMQRKPRDSKKNILSKELAWDIIIIGTIIGIFTLVLFWLYNNATYAKAQTMAFTAIVVLELVRLQLIRERYGLGLFSNRYLVWAIGATLLLQLLLIYSPLNTIFGLAMLNVFDWLLILASGAALVVVNWLLLKIETIEKITSHHKN